ncbi:MAG: STAS domain-containing protein [Candidatus Competibacteraceae bacterium]|nr:STAS domain-containing protein [Candidatus Competibacteraceae bacterium]
MDIEVDERHNATALKLHGRLDANTAVDLDKQLTALIENDNKAVVLDFSAMAYISSAGLRILLTAAKKLQSQQRAFLLCAINANIMEVFKMTGFHRILQIHDNLDQALNALS